MQLAPFEKIEILKSHIEGTVQLTKIAEHYKISRRSLSRWVKEYKEKGVNGLIRTPKKNNDSKIPKEIKELIEGLSLQRPKKSYASIYRTVNSYIKKTGFTEINYYYVRKIIKLLPQALIDLAHKGEKYYNDTYELVVRREADGSNRIWQADHTLLDTYVYNEEGKLQRPWISIIIDDYSRAIAGFDIFFESPSAIQTALTLRQAIWYKDNVNWPICGIPEILYTDHGSDFTSEHIESVCLNLKIHLIFSQVGKPRGRGRIERFFSTLNQKLLCERPGYKDGSGKAKEYMDLSTLEKEVSNYILNCYHVEEHSATNKTPVKRWCDNNFVPQMPKNYEELSLLLLTIEKPRRVNKDGIKLYGMHYISPILSEYVGEYIVIRYDPKDLGEIWVYQDQKYLCKAICQELNGDKVSLKEIIKARNKYKKKLKQIIASRRSFVDEVLSMTQVGYLTKEIVEQPKKQLKSTKIKLYENE